MLETQDAIATRNLYFFDKDGDRREVKMEIGRPKPSEHPYEFFCPFRITGIGDECIKSIFDVDEVQALQLAMKLIGPFLQELNSKSGIALKWDAGRFEDFGFPIE